MAGTEPGSATATRARLALELAAEPDNVGVARRALRDLLVAAGVDKERVSDIALAVSEACANAVLHAYAAHGGTFEVRAALASGSLAVAVSDHGSGMAPRSDSPGLGVGLPVMAAIADVLEIDAPAGAGTVVRMTFDLPAPRR